MNIKFSKLVVIGLFALLIVFTVKMIMVYEATGGVPDSLIVAVFGAGIGEFSVLGMIKKAEEKNNSNINNL